IALCTTLGTFSCGRGRGAGHGLEAAPACWPKPAICRQLFVAAHRGLPNRLPENSLAGARAALEARADLVSVEVRPTGDGVPVAMADLTVDRTTDGQGLLEELTLAQVKALTLRGATGDPETQRVPTAAELLALAAPFPALVHLDAKVGKVDALAQAVRDAGME